MSGGGVYAVRSLSGAFRVSGRHFLPWFDRENVNLEKERMRFREVRAVNRALMGVYVLKDELGGLLKDPHEGYAQRRWFSCCRRETRRRIKPRNAIARELCGYLPGRVSVHGSY